MRMMKAMMPCLKMMQGQAMMPKRAGQAGIQMPWGQLVPYCHQLRRGWARSLDLQEQERMDRSQSTAELELRALLRESVLLMMRLFSCLQAAVFGIQGLEYARWAGFPHPECSGQSSACRLPKMPARTGWHASPCFQGKGVRSIGWASPHGRPP